MDDFLVSTSEIFVLTLVNFSFSLTGKIRRCKLKKDGSKLKISVVLFMSFFGLIPIFWICIYEILW